MGARPVALLDSLRFGPLGEERNRYLFREVVRGIGGYGNAVGVPTVGGEVEFADAYSGNPLVNAMCVGLIRVEDLMRSGATEKGTWSSCSARRPAATASTGRPSPPTS